MTNGVGNPDWQRRYVTSAAPLFTGTFLDDTARATSVRDTNGFQYLIVTTSNIGSATYEHILINWFQDSAATQSLGATDWVIPPNNFVVQKVPVITRYYTMEIIPVGGVSGHNTTGVIYGTNADQQNLLTQNTALPQAYFNGSVATTATQTTTMPGMYGGEAMIYIDDNVNNKWTAWLQYYDYPTQAWVQFWAAHGTDKGQAWVERILMPYAPIRMNIRNDDTVSHIFIQSLMVT